jgi:hypothetical protein
VSGRKIVTRLWPLVAFPIAKLVLHLVTIPGYGFFRDEFYYIACSERLDFGYVDHPPLSILVLRIARALAGDSIWTIRAPAALAGAITVLIVGLIARELGGGRFAQSIAMIAAGLAPVSLALNHFYSMNALDLLFWALAALLVARCAKGPSPRLWVALGLVLGLGLQNKISVLWLGFGLFAGFLLTPRVSGLRTAWPWVAGAIAAAVFLPHVLWQVAHDWPTLEFIRNATQEKMVRVTPWDFLKSQISMMNPLAAPLWGAGLAWLLLARETRVFRSLGIAYVAVFLLLALSGSSRAGYLAPAYGWLLPAGGVILERWTGAGRRTWIRVAALGILAGTGAALAPLALPVLPVDTYIVYARALGEEPSTAERKELAELPQFYADMHGWDAVVSTVAEVSGALPPGDRARAVVFAQNYGVAGAVEFLGKKRKLPPAVSGHNNYWLWGPGDSTGEVVVIVGGEEEDHREHCGSVERAAVIECGRCMPYENHNPVFVCRGLKIPPRDLWPRLKHFD